MTLFSDALNKSVTHFNSNLNTGPVLYLKPEYVERGVGISGEDNSGLDLH